ncbi:hypothetical protein A4G18_06025 [Pasteurellaceae bacterium Pebbles2]|nr:hypothetical protein [Pasteurellaceae bacterium Pebbles2]
MKPLLLLTLCTLSACTWNEALVPEQPPKKAAQVALDKATQTGKARRYVCKDEKIVRVVRVMSSSKNTKKVKTDEINLTFGGVTEKLNATLSQTGKSYTNIHWHWFEKADSNTLLNSVGQILAEECIEHK